MIVKLETSRPSRRLVSSSSGDGYSGGMPRSASCLCCVVTLLSAPLILNYLVGPCLVCPSHTLAIVIHTQTQPHNGTILIV